MRIYKGSRTIDGIQVTVDGVTLDTRYDIKRCCDTGFEWTYEGDAPAQLALALLAEHLGDSQQALAQYESFMRRIVANFDNDWEMTSADMEEALASLS